MKSTYFDRGRGFSKGNGLKSIIVHVLHTIRRLLLQQWEVLESYKCECGKEKKGDDYERKTTEDNSLGSFSKYISILRNSESMYFFKKKMEIWTAGVFKYLYI